MTELKQYDLRWILRLMPESVLKLMKDHPNQLFLAGGFIRDCVTQEKPKDVDLFCGTVEQAKAWAMDLARKTRNKTVVTDNAVTVCGMRPSVQFIHRWTYTTPQECVQSFDFTIASAAVWHDGKRWMSTCHEDFYADLAARRLVYMCPQRNEDAGGSMLRVLKFYQRGYRIPLYSLGQVIARLLNGVERECPLFWEGRNKNGDAAPEREVEAYRAKILGGLLREVDPNVDPSHVAHIPDLVD